MIDIAMGVNFHSPHGLSFSHTLNHGSIEYEFDRIRIRPLPPFSGFCARPWHTAFGLTEALGKRGGRARDLASGCRRFCPDYVAGFAPSRGREEKAETSSNPEASQKARDLRAPRGFPSQCVSGTFHAVHSFVVFTAGFVRE